MRLVIVLISICLSTPLFAQETKSQTKPDQTPKTTPKATETKKHPKQTEEKPAQKTTKGFVASNVSGLSLCKEMFWYNPKLNIPEGKAARLILEVKCDDEKTPIKKIEITPSFHGKKNENTKITEQHASILNVKTTNATTALVTVLMRHSDIKWKIRVYTKKPLEDVAKSNESDLKKDSLPAKKDAIVEPQPETKQ